MIINHLVIKLILIVDKKSTEPPIYEQPEINYGSPNPDACSLRRTRSLAVIREETFNDLQISGIRTRRSQLIPRAKLVDRSFFKDRYINVVCLSLEIHFREIN